MEAEFLALMGSTIQWEATASIDGYGKPTFKAPVGIPCRIKGGAVQVTGPDNSITTAEGEAWLGGHYPAMTTADRITLPSGEKRGIVGVETVYDEAGPHHTKITYGGT